MKMDSLRKSSNKNRFFVWSLPNSAAYSPAFGDAVLKRIAKSKGRLFAVDAVKSTATSESAESFWGLVPNEIHLLIRSALKGPPIREAPSGDQLKATPFQVLEK